MKMNQNASTSESAEQIYTRSKDFYFKDGDVVIRVREVSGFSNIRVLTALNKVGEVLYRLHSGVLRSRLDVFNGLDILEHAQQPQSDVPITQSDASAPREGSDDQHPISPPQVTSVEWEHLLTLMYKKFVASLAQVSCTYAGSFISLGPPPYPLEFLVSVLKLASQWGMHESKEWAFDQLQSWVDDGEIDPVLQFRLGVQYNRQGWVRDALRNLVAGSLDAFTPYLADLLGFQGYQVFTRLTERSMHQCFEKMVGGLTLDVPHSVSCQQHSECTLAWRSAWSQRITQLLSGNWVGNWTRAHNAIRFPRPSTMDIKCYKLAVTSISDTIYPVLSDMNRKTLDDLVEEMNQIPFETLGLTAVAMVLAGE